MPRGSFRWIASIAFCAMPLSFALPQSAPNADIVWSRDIRPFSSVPARLVIAGTKTGGKFTPSYVVLPDAEEGAESEPLPWLTNLLPTLGARPFGEEERARVSRSDDGTLTIACSAGRRPAGVVLKAPGFHYPRGLRGELVVAGTARGGASVALVDAGAEAAGTPIAPEGGPDDVLARLPSSSWEQGSPAKQLVIGCPERNAAIQLRAIRIVPKPERISTGLGTWLWDVAPWLDQPDRLVALARSRGLTDLYVQIRIAEGRIAERGKLLLLLRKLAAAGITPHAVEGDPQMATPAGRAHALGRARALRAFYAEAGGVLKPAQYDIEPYLLPQFDSDPARWWNEWALSVDDLARALGQKISVAVPFWMLGKADGRAALLRIRGSAASIVVMAYRTDAAELEAIAGRWLDWGNREGMTVRIALENGPLPVEYHRTYALSENGEVLLDRSGATHKIVMLAAAVAGSSTRPAYSFIKEAEVSPKRISFMNDQGKLNEVLRKLRPNLSASKAFGGVLVHEIMSP